MNPSTMIIPVPPLELGHVLKVHAIDTGDCGWHSQDGSPCSQPPGDVSLLRLPDHQARFKGKRQHLAKSVELFLRAGDVVTDITEEGLHFGVDGLDFGML